MDLLQRLLTENPLRRWTTDDMIRRLWTEAGRPMYGHVLYLGGPDRHLLTQLKRRFKPRRMMGLNPHASEHAGLPVLQGVQWVAGGCLPLPFDDAVFDVAAGINACTGVAAWQQGVAEVARVLKPGGVFVFEDISEDLYSLLGVSDWLSSMFGIEPRDEDERALNRSNFFDELAKNGLSLNFQRNLLLEGWFEGVATKE